MSKIDSYSPVSCGPDNFNIRFDNAITHFNKIILSELYDNDITCWVSGGAVRDYFMGNLSVSDYDLFFPTQEKFDLAYKYFKDKESEGLCEFIWESDNGCKVKYKKKTFDLVKFIQPTPEACLLEFDFTVCMFAITSISVHYHSDAFIDLSKRQLMVNVLRIPRSTIKRVLKYTNKGFKICSGELQKIVEELEKQAVQRELNTAAKEFNDPLSEFTNNSSEEQEVSMSTGFFRGID